MILKHRPRDRRTAGDAHIDACNRANPISVSAPLARTWIALDGTAIAGYFALTTGSIRADDAPRKMARRMPRYPMPIILLARLAVDSRYQRQQLGAPRSLKPFASACSRRMPRPHACSSSTRSTSVAHDCTSDGVRRYPRQSQPALSQDLRYPGESSQTSRVNLI